MNAKRYPVVLVPSDEEDGGGFIAYVPDLPGCMSDGETAGEAAANVCEAIEEWCAEARESGRVIPAPGSAAERLRVFEAKVNELLRAQDRLIEAKDSLIEAQERLVEGAERRVHHLETELVAMRKSDVSSDPAWFLANVSETGSKLLQH